MAYHALDDLQIYQDAARFSDRIYVLVRAWSSFDSHTVGSQLVRAADSVGANIAESYGRFHYAERVQFYYYARGSSYETIYWLKRAGKRGLLSSDASENAVTAYSDLIASLNKVIKMTNDKRRPTKRRGSPTQITESRTKYLLADSDAAETETDPF